MITKYIKVPAYVFSRDDDDVKITRKFLSDHRGFEYVLNRKLLEYSLDDNAFMGRGILLLPGQPAKHLPRGTVRASDWVAWVHDDDGLDNITSITTVCFNIEDKVKEENIKDLWIKSTDDKRELTVYMYLKVEAKEELSEEDTHNLLDYISGQLSDGWGENFSVDYDKYVTHLIDYMPRLEVVDEISRPVWLPW